MRPFSEVSGITLREIAQSLLEAKRMARSIENVAETFEPLVDAQDRVTQNQLAEIKVQAINISTITGRIYSQIARDAMAAG